MKDAKLYVVEQMHGCRPKLTVYPLREERDRVWIVDLRGSAKVLRKDAAGRSYFTDEVAAVAFLCGLYREERDRSVNRAAALDLLLRSSDEKVLAYARGDEDHEWLKRMEAEA